MNERRGGWIRPFELDPASADVELEPVRPDPAPGAREALPAAATLPSSGGGRFWRRLATAGFVAAVLAIVLDTAQRLADRIETDPLTGWPMAILIAMVAVTALALFGREAIQLHRLQRRSSLRAEGLRLASSDLHGRAPALLADVRSGLPNDPVLADAEKALDRHPSETLSDGERLRLFERHMLVPLDRRAYRLVLESARDIGLLTAISPYGLLDGLLVLWRTTLMVRGVARLYGIAPSPLATAALLRRCLRNAALAGLTDVATHAMLEHAGASIAAMLSARAGQGAGNALLAAKLGIEAIREARPLPFVEAAPPSLREVRKALLSGERVNPRPREER